MPNLASLPTVAIVLSTPFFTSPSPPKNWFPLLYIDKPIRPPSTAIAILAAQLAFAPSHFSPMGRETKGFVYVQCRCFKSASVVTESQNIPIPVEDCQSEEVLS